MGINYLFLNWLAGFLPSTLCGELDGILPWTWDSSQNNPPEAADETAKAKVDHILVPWVALQVASDWEKGPMDQWGPGGKYQILYSLPYWAIRPAIHEATSWQLFVRSYELGVVYSTVANCRLSPHDSTAWNLEEMPPFRLREKTSTKNKHHEIFESCWYIVFFWWM